MSDSTTNTRPPHRAEWTRYYTVLSLRMTKDHSEDYCRGCHMATYPGDSFSERYHLSEEDSMERLEADILERLIVELGPSESGWDYAIEGVTRDADLRTVASADHDGRKGRWILHAWMQDDDSEDIVEPWQKSLHGRVEEERKRAADEKKRREQSGRDSARKSDAERSLRRIAQEFGEDWAKGAIGGDQDHERPTGSPVE